MAQPGPYMATKIVLGSAGTGSSWPRTSIVPSGWMRIESIGSWACAVA